MSILTDRMVFLKYLVVELRWVVCAFAGVMVPFGVWATISITDLEKHLAVLVEVVEKTNTGEPTLDLEALLLEIRKNYQTNLTIRTDVSELITIVQDELEHIRANVDLNTKRINN